MPVRSFTSMKSESCIFSECLTPFTCRTQFGEETVGEGRVPASSLNDLDVLQSHRVRSAQVQSL